MKLTDKMIDIHIQKIRYFDIDLEVYSDYKYIATQKNGYVIIYTNKPELNFEGGFWKINSSKLKVVAKVKLKNVNWFETLRTIEECRSNYEYYSSRFRTQYIKI